MFLKRVENLQAKHDITSLKIYRIFLLVNKNIPYKYYLSP